MPPFSLSIILSNLTRLLTKHQTIEPELTNEYYRNNKYFPFCEKKKDQRRAHIRPATESVAVNRVDGPLEHPHDVGNN